MNKVVLFLTGTVHPDNMIFTKLQDSNIRKSHYIEALQFWMKEDHDISIVFVENSGFDITDFIKDSPGNERIEILHFQGNNYPKHLGKGLGELACFEYAYEHSKILKDANFIFKITGRHKMLNFSTFLDFYLENPETDIIVDFQRSFKFCDSRFFGFKPSFIIDYLLQFKSIINDSEKIYFEHILAKAALKAISEDYTFSPLVSCPRIEGMSGSSGSQYNSSYETWLQKANFYHQKYHLLIMK